MPKSDSGSASDSKSSSSSSGIASSKSKEKQPAPKEEQKKSIRKVQKSRSRSREKTRTTAVKAKAETAEVSPPKTRLYVKNLTKNVNTDHLQEIFGVYGNIKLLDLPIHDKTKMLRGYADIEFSTPEEAFEAYIHLHESQIDGEVVDCRLKTSNFKSRRGARVSSTNANVKLPCLIKNAKMKKKKKKKKPFLKIKLP
jgi:RNA-binding protein with serine-rich domain 1